MPRIYLPLVNIKENRISIADEKAHYLASVLRCRKGDVLIVFDGDGNCFRTTIIKSDKKEVIAEVTEKFICDLESSLNIVLVQGLLKGEKMDMVIQKTTELGVREIVPVVTGRSQIRETKKIDRWRKIAGEAARQSGRSVVPVVHEVRAFGDFLSNCDMQTLAQGIIFYEESGISLKDAIERMQAPPPCSPLTKGGIKEGLCVMYPASLTISILIGPEGGFTGEEVDIAKERGFFVASLGKRILRAETAAISAVALVQFLFGDMA